jgi:hypothetical protein
MHQKQSQEQQAKGTDALVDSIKRSDRWMICLTAIIALATFSNLIVFWLESKGSSKQTNELIKIAIEQSSAAKTLADNTTTLADAAKIQTDAAKLSADAAQAATNIAKKTFDQNIDTFRLDQRAWVGIKSSKMIGLVINRPVRAELYLTNSGKTVARNVSTRITIRSDFKPFNLKTFRAERPPPKGIASRFVIFPDSEFALPLYHSSLLTQERLMLIKTGIITVYLFGEITYNDIFDKTKLRVTEYCSVYDPGTNDFAFCPEGNNAN